jgi:hypothetical protein
LFVADAVSLAVLPRGPVAEPEAVVVLPEFVTVPFAVVVPPFGPVTVAAPVAPLMVLLTAAVPEVVLPRAEVAVPVAVTVLPLRVAELLAVPPRGPVAECCAKPADAPNANARIKAAVCVFFMANLLAPGLLANPSLLSAGWVLLINETPRHAAGCSRGHFLTKQQLPRLIHKNT